VTYLSQHNTERLRYWNLAQPGASADKIIRILYGCEKLIDPRIIIVCWPIWSRREKLGSYPQSITSEDQYVKHENEETDKNNFLKNVFLLEDYTVKNCWPYWDSREQRQQYKEPNLASDGLHYGVEHHKRFASLFLEKFGSKLK
jgi:hypothetical protein